MLVNMGRPEAVERLYNTARLAPLQVGLHAAACLADRWRLPHLLRLQTMLKRGLRVHHAGGLLLTRWVPSGGTAMWSGV